MIYRISHELADLFIAMLYFQHILVYLHHETFELA